MRKRFVYLKNSWWWGESTTIITGDAMAVVGLSVRNDSPGYGYVEELQVHESIREKGVGRELMQEVERLAREMGLKHLYLGARKTSFVVGWYMRMGYYVCEECTEYNPDLLFTMMKDLEEG